MYSGIKIINSGPCGKQLYQLEYSAYVQLFLPPIFQIALIFHAA